MKKLVLNGEMTNLLAAFIEDTETMEMHINSVQILTSFVLDTDDDDAQRILDMLRWLDDLGKFFRAIRNEMADFDRL